MRRCSPFPRPFHVRALALFAVALPLLGPPVGADDPPPPKREEVPPKPAEESVETLPDVVVTDRAPPPVTSASPVGPQPAITTPQPVGTVSGDELRYRSEGSLGDTLSHEPGVATSSFGPGASRPVIRGQGGERIRVLENGTGTLDVSSLSDDHAVPLDPTSVDRIEVIRGPATLRYGASAIGGVIYAHDGRIPEEAVGRCVTGRVGGALGTADDERSGYLVVAGQGGPWNWRASGFARRTGDIDIPGFAKSRRLLEAEGNPDGVGEASGTLPNSYARARGASVGLSHVTSRGYAGAAFTALSTNYGLPNEPEVHIEMRRYRADLRGECRYPVPGFKNLAWTVALADYRHTEFEGAEPGTIFEQQAAEGRLELVHCRCGPFEGAVGFQGSYTDLEVTGEEALLPAAKTAAGAVFVDEKVHLPCCFTLETGARLDVTSIDSRERRTFGAVSLASGLVFAPSPAASFALSAAFTQRAPTAFELFANGPHIATSQFEVGDPTLGLERAVGADLTYRFDGRLLACELTAYYQHYLDFIGLNPTGDVDVDSGLPVFAYARTAARLYGFEAEATLHVWRCGERAVDVKALADAVRADDLDAGTPLPRIPPIRIGGGVEVRDERWTARANVLHAFDQDRTGPNELPTDGYVLLDAGVSYAWRLGPRSTATLSLVGTNLLDDEVRYHTSFVKDLVPARGRSFRLSLDVTF